MAGIFRLVLARPESVREARTAVATLADDDEDRHLLELLTSELVTNAVVHGARNPHESILIRATRSAACVRVEVCDEGTSAGDAVRQGPRAEDQHGRGLAMVETLATDWGTQRKDGLNCVWFELDRR